jgi:uncharacterized protein GlcG (DUF336 family)
MDQTRPAADKRQAKKIAAAAEAEAKKFDVRDPRGQVVFSRMDGNQDLGNVAIDKAVTTARLRHPTTASDAEADIRSYQRQSPDVTLMARNRRRSRTN